MKDFVSNVIANMTATIILAGIYKMVQVYKKYINIIYSWNGI